MSNFHYQDLQTLLETLGFDPESTPLFSDENLMNLMNMTLSCLGGIRLILNDREKKRKMRQLQQLYISEADREEALAYQGLKTTFQFAIKKLMIPIISGKEYNDIDPQRHLIESFPNRMTTLCPDWLPIHWAVLKQKGDDFRMLQSMVKFFPTTIQQLDKEGRSVLHYACRLESPALVDNIILMSKDMSPNLNQLDFSNSNGALPLHNLARFSKSYELFQHVKSLYSPALEAKNKEGLLALHWSACKSINANIIKELINLYPESIRVKNNEGYLPLHCASQNTCIDVIKVVLDAYPEAIAVEDSDGGFPLHHACYFNHNPQVIKLMYESFPEAIRKQQHSNNLTPLHLAALNNDSREVMRYIISLYPESLRTPDKGGFLPLHCIIDAISSKISPGMIDCLRELLKAYPDAARHVCGTGDNVFHMLENKNIGYLVRRLVYNTCVDQNIDKYHEYNWIGRRLTILLYFHIVKSYPISFNTNASTGKPKSIEYFKDILIRICLYDIGEKDPTASPNRLKITNDIMHNIILFL